MKTHSFSLALLFTRITLAACTLGAAEEPVPPPALAGAPAIQFAETSFDFGKIGASAQPQHDFIFTNTGQAVLEITDVRPGCGCTTAGSWDRKVEPGQIGRIPLRFNPASFSGSVTKGASVTCNDPARSNVYLQFQATIWRPLEIQPAQLFFTQVEDDATNETRVVRIVSNLEDPLRLEAPASSSAAFRAELKTVRPGKEFELQVTYSGPVSNANPSANITLRTSCADQPVLNLTAIGMAQPAFAVFPPVIRLPVSLPGAASANVAIIRNNSHQALTLSEPAVNAEGVTARIQETEPGKTFRINLDFAPGFQARPGQAMELAVKTSHPKHPVLKVPINQ